jgi:hypothetical protein
LEKYVPEESLRSIPEAFYTYDGFRDWWRMPLVFPYQLMCVDSKDRAFLEKYDVRYSVDDPNKSSSQLCYGISRLQTDNKVLVFERQEETNMEYGIFVYASATQSAFGDEKSAWEAAAHEGFSGKPQMKSVEEMFAQYYAYEKNFVEPDGAANGSQPIRPETNRTSPPVGSRR